MSAPPLRSRPELAERNLRTLAANALRAGLPTVQVYAQDVRDLLAELDAVRQRHEQAQAAAMTALEMSDRGSPASMKAGVARVGAGR